MTRLENHLEKARELKETAERASGPAAQVELWFLAAYHLIEACAAKQRLHIQKHQRVPEELRANPGIFGKETPRVVEAFRYLDHEARAKFVYGSTGTKSDFARARASFETIEAICEEILR